MSDPIRSADLARTETLSITSHGTAGPRGDLRMVRVEINGSAIGHVGINVDLADLASALRPLGLVFASDAFQQSGDETVWMS